MNDPIADWLRRAAVNVLRSHPTDLIWAGRAPQDQSPAPGCDGRRRYPGGLHRHTWSEVAIVVEGEGFMDLKDGRCRFVAPQLAVLPAGADHSEGYQDGATTYAALWLTGLGSSMISLISRHRPRTGWDTPFHETLRGPLVRRLSQWTGATWERAEYSAMKKGAGHPQHGAGFEQFRADLLAVMSQLYRQQVNHQPPARDAKKPWRRHQRMLEQIRAYLDSTLDRPITVAELAGLTRLTPRYINRLFRQWAGVPIHEYLIRRRMETALKLCRESELLVKEIANRLGYDDPLYFSRAFHRYHGFSPAQARSRR